jgi:hypothetical protein
VPRALSSQLQSAHQLTLQLIQESKDVIQEEEAEIQRLETEDARLRAVFDHLLEGTSSLYFPRELLTVLPEEEIQRLCRKLQITLSQNPDPFKNVFETFSHLGIHIPQKIREDAANMRNILKHFNRSLELELKHRNLVNKIEKQQNEVAHQEVPPVKTSHPEIETAPSHDLQEREEESKNEEEEAQELISVVSHSAPVLSQTQKIWTVNHRFTAKKSRSLLDYQIKKFDQLMLDLATTGPIQANWPNFSKLSKSNFYHCHLGKGKHRIVVLWKMVNPEDKVIDVFYVGSHPSEYKKFLK